MVVGQGLVDVGENLLGDLLGTSEIVLSVAEHLGLDDGHEAVSLADGGVSRILQMRKIQERMCTWRGRWRSPAFRGEKECGSRC